MTFRPAIRSILTAFLAVCSSFVFAEEAAAQPETEN